MYKLGGGGLLVREPPPSVWRTNYLRSFARRPRSGQLLDGARDLELEFPGVQARLEVVVDRREEFDFRRQRAVDGRHLEAPDLRVLLGRDVQAAGRQGVLDGEDVGLGDAFIGGDTSLDGRGAHLGVGRRVADHEGLGDRFGEVHEGLHAVGDVGGDDRVDVAELLVAVVHLTDGDGRRLRGVQVLRQDGHGGTSDDASDRQGEDERGVLLHTVFLPCLLS